MFIFVVSINKESFYFAIIVLMYISTFLSRYPYWIPIRYLGRYLISSSIAVRVAFEPFGASCI
jgi:hypothetical protein